MLRGPSCAGLLLLGATACSTSSPSTTTPPATAASSEAVLTVEETPLALDVKASTPLLPRGLTSFGATTLKEQVYVLGGYHGTPHAYSSEGQSGELLRLDLATGAWTRLGEVDRAQSVALVASKDTLIRIGGMQARNDDGDPPDLHSVDTVARFDPSTATWRSLPSLPRGRSSHDAVVIGDKIWVVGGWTLQGRGMEGEWTASMLRLDLADLESGWTEHEAPFRRRALAVAQVDGRLAALGGMGSGRQLSVQLDLYDPESKTWSRGPDFPGSGFGIAAIGRGNELFASGADGTVYRWRTGETQWTPVATLAFPRFFHRLALHGDELLVLGGIRPIEAATRVRPIERIDLAHLGEPSVASYRLDAATSAKNRQGVAAVGDQLFVFGGNKSLGQHDFGPEFFTDEAAALDLASMRWSSRAPFPIARQSMVTTTTAEGDILSVGGFGPDGEAATSHPEVYAYDPGKDAWRQVGALPGRGRTQFGLADHGDYLWVFGGLDYDPTRPKNDHFRHVTPILRSPVDGDAIELKPAGIELREPRRAFGSTVLGSVFLMVGGMREGFELVDSCEAWSFEQERWETFPCPERPRLSPQMVALDGRAYLAGGSSKPPEGEGLEPNRALEVYDPKTKTWSVVLEELPIEPKHLRMLPYGNRLLLWSTHDEDGQAHVLLVDPGRFEEAPPR